MTDNETAQLRDVLAAVAANLPGWHVDTPHDHNARLMHTTGARVYARMERGRIKLTAGIPDGASYAEGDYGRSADRVPVATVAPDRDPVSIARGIARGIAPAAVDYFADVSARMGARIAAGNARETFAGELAAVMGGRVWQSHRDGWRADVPTSAAFYGELIPDHAATSGRCELRGLTADQLRELAAMVGRWAT